MSGQLKVFTFMCDGFCIQATAVVIHTDPNEARTIATSALAAKDIGHEQLTTLQLIDCMPFMLEKAVYCNNGDM